RDRRADRRDRRQVPACPGDDDAPGPVELVGAQATEAPAGADRPTRTSTTRADAGPRVGRYDDRSTSSQPAGGPCRGPVKWIAHVRAHRRCAIAFESIMPGSVSPR